MSYYWDPRFVRHLTGDIKTIIEVGARYGDESIELSNCFPDAHIYSYECNPLTVETCKKNLMNQKGISFYDYGLGEFDENKEFYSYILNNDGASSFFKRDDANDTQRYTGTIEIKKFSNVLDALNIEMVDLLCMDIQGFELNVLKGAGGHLKNIRYVIMEEPKPGLNSKYINAPLSSEIKSYMTDNGFIEIERIEENLLEDNVMYKRVLD